MRVFGKTHIGLVREINQDHIFLSQNPIGKLPNLFIIADGMGGHKAGEIASMLAVESFVDFCSKIQDDQPIEEIVIKATQYANNVIYDRSIHTSEMSGMGTTLVTCTIVDDVLYVGNVGDSRLYVLNEDLKQITIDHSFVEELVRAGEISREESYYHPAKNKITRALGVGYEVDVDVFKLNTQDFSKILMGSDGLTNMISDVNIQKILTDGSTLSEQGEKLLTAALTQGGLDNISIILIEQNN